MEVIRIFTVLIWIVFGLNFNYTWAQGTKLGTPKIDRLFPQQNFGVDNHFLLREAERQLRLLDFEQAEITLDYALAQNPQSIDVLVQRAKYNRRLGRKERAEADIALVNRQNPYAADLYGYNGPHGLLNVLAFLPHKDSSYFLPVFRQVLPYYFDALKNSDSFSSIESERLLDILYLIEIEQWNEALEKLDGLLWVFPESGVAMELKAMILIIQKQFQKAEIAVNKTIAIQSGSALLWYHYSCLELQRVNYNEAMAHIDRAIAIEPDISSFYLQRAGLYRIRGDFSAALDDYDRVIEQSDWLQQEALINRGITRKLAGDFQGAFADLNLVLQNGAEKAQIYQNRANLYLFFGFTNLAIADYTEAIARKEHYVEAFYNRGLAHFLRFDPLAACQDLEQSANLGFEKAAEMQRFFCIE